MFSESQRLFYAALSAFVCIGFIAACGYTENARVLLAFKIGAWIFAIITAIIMGTIVAEEYYRSVEVVTDFMREFGKLDDEARAAVAFRFPAVRYHMKSGLVRGYFEDTNVPMETFRLFLQTSNDKYISPRRDWYTAEKPEWAWIEIYDWLVENDKIYPDSASGNVGHLWRGNSYQHLTAYWMAGRRIVDTGAPPPPTESVMEG